MIESILAYQTVDARLNKIETELAKSEERNKAIKAKKYLEGVEENIIKMDMRAAELIDLFNKMEEERKALLKQEEEFTGIIAEVQDENQASFLIKKADEVLNRLKSIEGEVERINKEIQNLVKEFITLKNTVKAAKLQYAENSEKYKKLKEEKQSERDEIVAELTKLKEKVDPEIMAKYLQKRADKLFPIIYEVQGEVCGACNMNLSLSEISKLKNGEVIECDTCRRLLYKK